MLSIGLRFGQGFDKMSTFKVMQSIPVVYDYDLLIIGASPGAVALAMEARAAGKRTAIVRRKKLTPTEEQGFDEDMDQMAEALDIREGVIKTESKSSSHIVSLSESIRSKRNKVIDVKSSSTFESRLNRIQNRTIKKIRASRLDLNNELYRRGRECVRVMQNAAMLGELVEKANNGGWRILATKVPLTMNWSKLTEDIMDYVMEKNYNLMNELNDKSIRVIDGKTKFLDNHTVMVSNIGTESRITAELICLAPSGLYEFPKDVEGSSEHGISFDDFSRLYKAPGKTLVVGGTPEAFECAGILASCRFPVTIASRKDFLEGFDREITKMILANLRKKGVKFLENVTVKAIIKNNKNQRLIATYKNLDSVPSEWRDETEGEHEVKEKHRNVEYEEFDTVLFAVRKTINLKSLSLGSTGVEIDPHTGLVKTNPMEATAVSNIYAIGDCVIDRPHDEEVTELAGRLLGRRLFHHEEILMDYSIYPIVIYTPIEYAFVGITEDAVLARFGLDCIDVHHGFFECLDSVLSGPREKSFAKVIVYKPTNTIIGMHVFGPKAGEIIQGFATAVKIGLTWETLQSTVGVPGTSAQEVLKLPLLKFYEKTPTISDVLLGVSLHTN